MPIAALGDGVDGPDIFALPLHQDLLAELANLPHRDGEVFRRPDGKPYGRPRGDYDLSQVAKSGRRSKFASVKDVGGDLGVMAAKYAAPLRGFTRRPRRSTAIPIACTSEVIPPGAIFAVLHLSRIGRRTSASRY